MARSRSAGGNKGPREISLVSRLDFSRIGAREAALLAELRETFEAHAGDVVDRFYNHLLEFEPLRPFFAQPETVRRLQSFLRDYLISLTAGKYDEEYQAGRLLIGRAHERVGLAPQWYLGAYSILLEALIPLVVQRHRNDAGRACATVVALTKLMNVDAQIVLEAYFETRHKKAIARSEQLAAVGELAASIAHEVRNPLAGMKGAMEMLRRPLAKDPGKLEVLDEVVAQIDRLEGLVRDLLTYARPNPLNRQPVKLPVLLERAVRLLQDGAELDGIRVRWDLSPDSGQVTGDPQQLEQVFLNLLHNGVQAMEGRGTLTVSTRTNGEQALITIADSGKGIPDDVLPHIFQPFYTTKHRGSGLGLPIVRKIVEAHGGTIRVDSEPGEGTVAEVSLPRLEVE